ncbi:FG-GAP repeat domain-containing protein [Streptomyces sp. NPDC021100]|uniref:FG-GAP repeat domain-containing protein n=1 Tax=Streptomyces sp. NPDC021100 TaxID=3365114 RepID=UPI00379D7D31
MTYTNGRRSGGRALPRVVTTAIAAALVAGTAGTALADGPAAAPAGKLGPKVTADKTATAKATVADPSGAAPFLVLNAIDNKGDYYSYQPNGKGGLTSRKAGKNTNASRNAWKQMRLATQRHDRFGEGDGHYYVQKNNEAWYADKGYTERVGTGWSMYDTVFSPGNLGGSAYGDVLGRDKSGVLWVYQADILGKLSARKKVGGGWGQFTAVAGRGDLTGDGKTDIVARDKSGTLWLYKGTGDLNKPFAGRTKIGGGWNKFDLLVGTGDVDGDGHADLLARDKSGALWLFKGTGKQNEPFKGSVKVGTGFGQYRLLF